MNEVKAMDTIKEVRDLLENLIGTMSVIYEGLNSGTVEEESPHCILVLQKAAENILELVEKELPV